MTDSPLAGLPPAGQLHLLMLRASGRVPDATMLELRRALAEGRLDECAAGLASSPAFALTADEIEVLAAHAPPGAALPSPVEGPADTAPRAMFVAVPPADLAGYGPFRPPLLDSTGDPEGADLFDEVVLGALDPGATAGVWRTWRIDIAADGTASSVRVYVIEIDVAAGDLPGVTQDVQQALLAAGDPTSQVETYRPYLPLPAYQWAARANSALIWAPYPAPRIRVAAEAAEPSEVPAEERGPALDYLRSAAPLTTVDEETLFTDGWWVWSGTLADRLDRHGVLADPDLLDHLRSVGFALWEVDAVAAHRALAGIRAARGDEIVDDREVDDHGRR